MRDGKGKMGDGKCKKMDDGKCKTDNVSSNQGFLHHPYYISHVTSFGASGHLLQHIPHFAWDCFQTIHLACTLKPFASINGNYFSINVS